MISQHILPTAPERHACYSGHSDSVYCSVTKCTWKFQAHLSQEDTRHGMRGLASEVDLAQVIAALPMPFCILGISINVLVYVLTY